MLGSPAMRVGTLVWGVVAAWALSACSGEAFQGGGSKSDAAAGAGGSAAAGSGGTGVGGSSAMGGSSATGGNGGSGGCPPSKKLCDGQCVEPFLPEYGCANPTCDPCPAGHVCASGKCTDNCPSGTTNCNGTCAVLSEDEANCGQCGKQCLGGPNAGPECNGGQCRLSCFQGFGDCDSVFNNGCEVDTNQDVKHCGGCDKPCFQPPPGAAGPVCVGGGCGCATGKTQCAVASTFACVDSTKDPKFCGKNCTECPPGQGCVAGVCTKPPCAYGLTMCSGTCVSLDSDWDNCGACGKVCDFSESCKQGKCIAKGSLDCSGAFKACADDCTLMIDSAHCGGCNAKCAPGEACLGNFGCQALILANEPWECAPDKACPVPPGWPNKPALYYCASSCIFGGTPAN